jgi:hypothetical protein
MRCDEVSPAENLAGARREYYRTFAGSVLAVQEQNMRFAVGMFGNTVGMLAAFNTHASLLYGHRPEEVAPRAGDRASRLPVDDYDRLGVEELGHRLEGLCVRDVEQLKAHEKRTRNRHSMMERLDRALV